MRRVMIYERSAGTPTPTPTASPTPTPSPTATGSFLYVVGNGVFGGINLNSTENRSSFVVASSESGWKKVSIGYAYALYAQKTNNLWYCTGSNANGQLGLSDQINRSSLVQFSTATTWTDFYTDQLCTFAKKTDDSLWSWGSNGSHYYTGQGVLFDTSSPVQIVSGDIKTVSVFLGGMITLGNNDVQVWGQNVGSRFGGSPGNDYSIPTQRFTPGVWKQASTSDSFSILIRNDGTLWGVGNNFDGQLGNNNTVSVSSITQIGASTTWKNAWTGYSCSFAIKNDNSLWAWGYNLNGQLGTNNTTSYSSPVQIAAGITYAELVSRWKFNALRDTSGKLWTWGDNSYGNLAQNNAIQYSSPTQVTNPLQYWQTIGCGYGSLFGVLADLPPATDTPVPTSEPATPSPTPQATNPPTPQPTASTTPVPTNSPTPQPTASATPAPTASRTPTPTASPVPTNTATPAPTASVTPAPTPSATAMPNPTVTIPTGGTTIQICYPDSVTRTAPTNQDIPQYVLLGFNSAYGSLSINSYVSGSGTSCLTYGLSRPAYTGETAITISYDNTGCYLTRTSTGQCLPTYTTVPVSNGSLVPNPTNTPTITPTTTPTPTPSATTAAATPTPTISPTATSGPVPSPTGLAGCYHEDVTGGVTFSAITYGYDYSNNFTKGSNTFLFTVMADCNNMDFTVYVSNNNGNGGDAVILDASSSTVLTVADGTTGCYHFTGINIGETVGVGKGSPVTYPAGSVTGYIVSGGACP